MTIKKITEMLEQEIKMCEERCELFKEQGLKTLWEISDVRKTTCEDILKKIEGA